MIKRIKRWGNNLVIVFTAEDEKIYGMQEGDIIEIDDMIWESKMNKVKKARPQKKKK